MSVMVLPIKINKDKNKDINRKIDLKSVGLLAEGYLDRNGMKRTRTIQM